MITDLSKRLRECVMLLDGPHMTIKDLTDIQGMSTTKTRTLPYLLTSLGSQNYLEVGTYCGSTFVPTMLGSLTVKGVCVDNWSYPGSSLDELKSNLQRYIPDWENRVQIVSGDWRTLTMLALSAPIDLYLYDGDHSETSHADALKVAHNLLADEFIFLVDDYNHQAVRNGTAEALKDYEVVSQFDLGDGIQRASGNGDSKGWWNGYFAAHLRKR